MLYDRPNLDIFKERVPRTVSIGLPALLIAVPISLLIGVITAVKRGKLVDQVLTFFVTLGMGTPHILGWNTLDLCFCDMAQDIAHTRLCEPF